MATQHGGVQMVQVAPARSRPASAIFLKFGFVEPFAAPPSIDGEREAETRAYAPLHNHSCHSRDNVLVRVRSRSHHQFPLPMNLVRDARVRSPCQPEDGGAPLAFRRAALGIFTSKVADKVLLRR